MTNIIKIENVWKTYDLGKIKLNVLKNVSLEIDQGDFAIILGPSGSGKSTLLNLVSCLDVPTKGNIFFKGKNISEFSEDELAEIRGKDIGFVFQRFNLLPHLTALENVVLPTIFQGKEEKESIGLAKNILESVGLKERLNHRPTELSGGENQRVAIARALINNPEIVVADEPTGNIDSRTGDKIMDILVELNKKEGKTVIVVTHNNDQVKYGNRIIRIKDGEIVK
ncbi:MAG: ABC transporter ATP-binding protein [Candidatus Pacebacteria bacterium]|nr:ABC transporter ATP-binding protein [Candidatus Paceibacterota bacterium]